MVRPAVGDAPERYMPNFEKARTVLEYDKILEMLADAAQTEGAKQRLRALWPQVTLSRVLALQAQTCLLYTSFSAYYGRNPFSASQR